MKSSTNNVLGLVFGHKKKVPVNSIDNVRYLPTEEYWKAKSYLRKFTVYALHWLASESQEELRDQIIGNFIARGTVCLDSIFSLWQYGNFQDCWILHRTLIDRWVHLKHLADHDEFEEFDRWTFQRRFKELDVTLSDPEITEKFLPEVLKEQKDKHKEMRKRINKEAPSTWNRPRAEDVAKQNNLLVLHRLGYNAASTLVHPMSDDGKEDFARLLGYKKDFPDDIPIVLHNSFACLILLIQTGLNSSNLLWRDFVFDFYEQIISNLESGANDYVLTYEKAYKFGPDFPWCKSKE